MNKQEENYLRTLTTSELQKLIDIRRALLQNPLAFNMPEGQDRALQRLAKREIKDLLLIQLDREVGDAEQALVVANERRRRFHHFVEYDDTEDSSFGALVFG
jgi:hypothetical protein